MRWLLGALSVSAACGCALCGTVHAQTAAPMQSSAQKHLAAGVQLASRKNYKEARLEFEKADAEQPGTFAVLFSLGQVYLQLGEYPKAEVTLNRAVKLATQPEETAETLYVLGETEAKEGRPLDALDTLVRARKLSSKNVDILYATAEISMSRGYFEDAIPLLEEGIALAPQRMDLQAALGECYFKSDKVARAVEVFNKLAKQRRAVEDHAYLGLAYTYLGRFADAKAEFNEGLKIEPGNSFCEFQLGYVAKLQGDTATAEAMLTKVLKAHPDYPAALLELATLRTEAKRYVDAKELLQRYVKVSPTAATGYYKLAMVEKKLQNTAAADEDLAQFQRLSKQQTETAHPYDHLMDYLDSRAQLSASAKATQDVETLEAESKAHPEQAEVSYALAEAYLRAGRKSEARQVVAAFDGQSAPDVRTLTGLGVLLARFGLYQDAVAQFQMALQAKPEADDVKFDLAMAYFRKSDYPDAKKAVETISEAGQKDDAYAALVADIDAHLGDTATAEVMYSKAIAKNPDNDQAYLSLALLELRQNRVADARATLQRGQRRVPGSGKIYWGLGLAATLDGDVATAGENLERAVELMPEWQGSYSILGFFYFQTGQVTKARDVLERFKNNGAPGELDLQKIENALDGVQDHPLQRGDVMDVKARVQVFQLAAYLADTTL